MRFMMKNIALVSVFTTVLIAAMEVRSFGQAIQQPNADPERTNDNVVKLFNGLNFDGWYTFLQNRGRDNDPKNVFTVQDGMIRISGEEWGCITTHDEYENYSIVVEFK